MCHPLGSGLRVYAERSCDRLRSPTARCNIFDRQIESGKRWRFSDAAPELLDVLMSVIIVADAIPERCRSVGVIPPTDDTFPSSALRLVYDRMWKVQGAEWAWRWPLLLRGEEAFCPSEQSIPVIMIITLC